MRIFVLRFASLLNKFIKNDVLLNTTWGFPSFCIAASLIWFGLFRKFDGFGDGIFVELCGFAITVLFFDFYVIRNSNMKRLLDEEKDSNTRIARLLGKYAADLQKRIRNSFILPGQHGKAPNWDADKMEVDFGNTLHQTSYLHAKPRGTIQRNYHLALDTFENAQSHVVALLPTVKVASEKGEVFEQRIYECIAQADRTEGAHNWLLNSFTWHRNDKNSQTGAALDFYQELREFTAMLGELENIVQSKTAPPIPRHRRFKSILPENTEQGQMMLLTEDSHKRQQQSQKETEPTYST